MRSNTFRYSACSTFWFLIFLWICIVGLDANGFAQAKAKKRAASPRLSLVAKNGEKDDGKTYSYDFGRANLMDYTQYMQDLRDILAIKLVIPGLKHEFILQNNTPAPITIVNMESDCYCMQALVYKDKPKQEVPYVVEPRAQVRVRAALDYYAFAAGPASSTIIIYGMDLKTPVATLTLKVQVDSGINFSADTGKFGEVPTGQAAFCTFALTLDKRAPNNIPPGTLQVVSTNPYVKITSVPQQYVDQGIEVNGDQIVFPNRQLPDLEKDIVLTFRADLAADAPPGPLSGEIRLVSARAPLLLIARNAVAPIRGEVLKKKMLK